MARERLCDPVPLNESKPIIAWPRIVWLESMLHQGVSAAARSCAFLRVPVSVREAAASKHPHRFTHREKDSPAVIRDAREKGPSAHVCH